MTRVSSKNQITTHITSPRWTMSKLPTRQSARCGRPRAPTSEALVAFARADRMTDARESVARMGITLTPLTAQIAERAAGLRAEHERLRLPDALVLATARELGAAVLTYDDRVSRIATRN